MFGMVKNRTLPEKIRWCQWAGYGLEHVVLSEQQNAINMHSAIIWGAPDDGFAVVYSLTIDSNWRAKEIKAAFLGSAESMYLRRDDDGDWFDVEGRPLPNLKGVIDVDLSISALTNSLPIRRLRLAEGESAEIVTAYVAFPELTVSQTRNGIRGLAQIDTNTNLGTVISFGK